MSVDAQKKRDVILNEAIKIFAKEGFRNTDVQVIADQAQVGKGTVYRYFGTKEQLFLAASRYCMEQVGVFVEKQLGGAENVQNLIDEKGMVEVLKLIARACAEYYRRRPQAVEIMIQERAEFREAIFPSHLMFRAETRAELDQMLANAMKQKQLRMTDPVHATNAFGDLIWGSVVNGCLEGKKSKLVDRVEAAVDIFLHGLAYSR